MVLPHIAGTETQFYLFITLAVILCKKKMLSNSMIVDTIYFCRHYFLDKPFK